MLVVEIIIILCVVIYQVRHTYEVFSRIGDLKEIFSSQLFLKTVQIEKSQLSKGGLNIDEILDQRFTPQDETGDLVDFSLIESNGRNETISKIKKAINTYLVNNYGAAVNFSIIKDIVDREIDVVDEEISQSVTLPLYLGLAVTMLGIIVGLLSLPAFDSNNFELGLNTLIDGVKYAMSGSLVGLFCTVLLSSFIYKNAKHKLQKDKNEQITYLQAYLLPELIKAEDTGVSGLKASLDRFARVATKISDNVIIAAKQTGANLEMQQSVIEKVKSIDVLKVTEHNLQLFDKIESNIETFHRFSSYVESLEKIASQLVQFGHRTKDINRVIENVDRTLEDSNELLKFLSVHFDKIESSGNAALKSVGLAEKHFEDAISDLKLRTDEMINNLYKNSGDHESNLQKVYNDIEKSISSITLQYISSFKELYSNSIPDFSQLDYLRLIQEINNSLQDKTQNQLLLDKLSSIEHGLRRKEAKAKTKTSGELNYKEGNLLKEKFEEKEEDHVGLGDVFKKLF